MYYKIQTIKKIIDLLIGKPKAPGLASSENWSLYAYQGKDVKS
jgi:hypothetical protein